MMFDFIYSPPRTGSLSVVTKVKHIFTAGVFGGGLPGCKAEQHYES
jgi:hypothetical protein